MGPGSGLALDGGGARAVVLTLGSVLNVKQLLLKSLLLFLLNVNDTIKQCFSVNVEHRAALDPWPFARGSWSPKARPYRRRTRL